MIMKPWPNVRSTPRRGAWGDEAIHSNNWWPDWNSGRYYSHCNGDMSCCMEIGVMPDGKVKKYEE